MMGPRRRGAMVGSWQGRRECPYRVDTGTTEDAARGRPARPGDSVLHCERGFEAVDERDRSHAAIPVRSATPYVLGNIATASTRHQGSSEDPTADPGGRSCSGLRL